MWEEIERNEMKHNAVYKEINHKIEEILRQVPELTDELMELEGWFQDINITSQAEMYIAGYNKGQEMLKEELSASIEGKPKALNLFRRKNILNQAK